MFFGGPLHKFLSFARSRGNGVDIAMAFDREAYYRFAGFGDSFDDASGPAGLDADDYAGCNVRIAARADERAEMQFQVFAKLQTPVGVRKRQGPLDVVGDGFRAGVGQIVEWKNDHMIANANSSVLTPIAEK